MSKSAIYTKEAVLLLRFFVVHVVAPHGDSSPVARVSPTAIADYAGEAEVARPCVGRTAVSAHGSAVPIARLDDVGDVILCTGVSACNSGAPVPVHGGPVEVPASCGG